MAEVGTVIRIAENSPEEVAYKLMRSIAEVEKLTLSSTPSGGRKTANRQWILTTYSACLKAVQGK